MLCIVSLLWLLCKKFDYTNRQEAKEEVLGIYRSCRAKENGKIQHDAAQGWCKSRSALHPDAITG